MHPLAPPGLRTGAKLHTNAFSPRPVPAGAVGDEYTMYILDRTRTFMEMGQRLYPKLEAMMACPATDCGGGGGAAEFCVKAASGSASSSATGSDGGGGELCGVSTWEDLDEEFQRTKWVGPTLSKVSLDIHDVLCRQGDCEVGYCEVGCLMKLIFVGSEADGCQAAQVRREMWALLAPFLLQRCS